MLSKFFIWCAGSDKDILNYAPTYERNRHAGLGATLFIPATLGLISMSYALSTFLDNMAVCIILGLIWAMIIFSVDRYIVSTYRKKPSAIRNIFSFQFIIRMVFSVFLGIVIAHPLVLRFFEDNISDYNKEKHETMQEYQIQSDSVLTVYNTKLDYLNRQKKRITGKIFQASEDMKIEKAGQQFEGYSGQVGEGLRFEAHKEFLERNEALLSEVNDQIETFRVLMSERMTKLTVDTDIPGDFISNEVALGEMKQGFSPSKISVDGFFMRDQSLAVKGRIMGIVELFILIMFVILDIIPVLFKTISYYGMHYDKVIDQYEEADIRFEGYSLPKDRKKTAGTYV